MTGVEQRPRDDPDRVREVDDPCVGRGALADALRDLEHDRDRAQRLGEAPGAGRLLADAAAGERHGLVGEARRLAADANLDEHEIGAVDRAVELAGDDELAAEPLLRSSIRAASPPTTSRRSASMSWSASSVTSIRSRSRESPETSSGVYVEPPPTTAIFIPSPPSA